MSSTVRLFTIAGIPISVHASWLAVYALITWTLAAGYFPRVLPELGPIASWILGLVAALLLFASVLVHELAHSVVATDVHEGFIHWTLPPPRGALRRRLFAVVGRGRAAAG